MAARHVPTRYEAARMLGVAPDAQPAEVKRAFRLWAAWAHPDQGGSSDRFAELCAARDLLLGAAAVPPSMRDPGTIELRPRRSWREVLVRPSPPRTAALALSLVATVAAVLVAGPAPLLAVPAALASAAWCIAVSRVILAKADHGHVIVVRSLAWMVATCAQIAVALVAGISLIEVLPLLALPFVAAIAAVNPAAGLRRGAFR